MVSRHITRVFYKEDGAGYLPPARWQLWTVHVATGKTTALTDSDRHDALDPAWSPDGTTIVFDSNRSGNRDLWSIPAGGGTAVQLTTDSGADQDPDWSPGSSHLAYSDDGDIFVIPAGGGGGPAEVKPCDSTGWSRPR